MMVVLRALRMKRLVRLDFKHIIENVIDIPPRVPRKQPRDPLDPLPMLQALTGLSTPCGDLAVHRGCW